MQIEELSIEQLLELNTIICRRIDQLRARADQDVLIKLRLGQEVHFQSREGQVFGRVIKINQKTVLVRSEDNRQWKLPAGMIKLLQDLK
ncbi:MAG: transposase [Hahellaceae bacterium]|nr:transposase [Hahellaceae bacterium]